MHRRGALPLLLLAVSACQTTGGAKGRVSGEGLASFYGPGLHGQLTASGERFDKNQLTAAHKTLPFGTCVEVTSLSTGRSVRVRINDRGPFVAGRIIDVSEAAARDLGMISAGVSRVRLSACSF
jgi:rare lipoprotein A